MSILIRFIIPNRIDSEADPVRYLAAHVDAVPREGEAVNLGVDADAATPWVVKWVSHSLDIVEGRAGAHRIDVRLIEPLHWSRR